MIRVVTSDNLTFTAHIGEIDKLRQLREVAHKILFLQANGDELDFILGRMSVPTVTGLGIISWYGDDAKFIAGNFPYGE